MSAALEPFLTLWGLEFVGRPVTEREPYPGTGEVAFVRRGGEALVLKLAPEGTDEARSGEVLRHWDGHGAVRLVAMAPGAVLIERALPGGDLTGLVKDGRDDEATLVLCEVMEKLNRPAPAGADFRSVRDLGKGFARMRPAALATGVDGPLIDRAEALYFRLCDTQDAAIVLHADLQHYNVVHDAVRGWLAIDPKGNLGEPAYEAAALMRNPIAQPELAADPKVVERRARLISERLGYPFERVVGWCFSQWVLSILWAIEDGLVFAPDWLSGPQAAAQVLGADR